jgi:hypothetical protein
VSLPLIFKYVALNKLDPIVDMTARLIANEADSDMMPLPPFGAVDWMDAFFNSGCIDKDDEVAKRIATLCLLVCVGH